MTELERALHRLGRELDVPPAPDLPGRVRVRLQRARRRRRLVPVLVALVAALAVALAVPSSRGAILRFFHLQSAEVTVVDRLPPVAAGPVRLGKPATLEQLPFRPLLLDGERPDGVSLDGSLVWLRYGQADRPRLLVAELVTGGPVFLKKVAGGATRVEYVSVGGDQGIWIEGARHLLTLPGGPSRLSDNTLLWQHGQLTLRLEARIPKARAIELALRFR